MAPLPWVRHDSHELHQEPRDLNGGPRPSHPYRSTEPRSETWRKADSLWELREDPSAARQSLKAYRSAAKKQKKVPELKARVSHACVFVATFVEFSPEVRDRLFREGQKMAQEAMMFDPPHRIAGNIPTRLSEGDLQASKAHFEKAVSLAPLFLGNRVAYADFYAVRIKDKKLFMDLLTQVVVMPADTLPEIAPENRISQAQAKALVARAASLFP